MRPEHLFEYHEQAKPGWERVDLKVDVVEPMGMETMVHFFLGGDPICARVAPETAGRARRDPAADRRYEQHAPDGAGQRAGGVGLTSDRVGGYRGLLHHAD